MKGRYQKERFGKILFKRLIIPFLVAFIAHCVIYAVFLKFKIPYFRSNDSIAHVNLVEQLEYDPDYNQAFMLYYPGYDYGHSGIDKTALVLDSKTKEIIACDEFTLPDNKVLASYLEDSGKYKEDLEKVTENLNFSAKRGNLEDSSIFGMKYYNISTGKNVDGRNVTIFTVMRVNYYLYFFKYIFPVDLVLFFSAFSVSLALTFQKKKIDFKDEYRRAVINSLSHDLKTPLTIISGCAENLKENVDPEKREFYEDAIIENAKYTEKIINDALELSRSENNSKAPEFEKFELRPMAEEIIKKYEVPASERRVTVNITGNSSVKADRKMINQLLENLISNAVKYTDENGSIDIKFEPKCFTVTNDFTGKITTDIDRLREPFVRGTSERSGRNGSGVGLAIVSNIIETHRYKMGIGLNEGRFSVTVKMK